jgi:hypothetical protein
LWEKFADCASRSLPRHNIAPLFERLNRIETLGSVGDLMPLLALPDSTVRRIA